MKKPIVIKIGSQLILDCLASQNDKIHCQLIDELLKTVQNLQSSGHHVIMVISGAVSSGANEGLLTSRQAQAARGQILLSSSISNVAPPEMKLALLLLSREDIVNRKRYLSLQDTFTELLDKGIVPIVNENDATTIKDKNDFPDNDHLAAIIAITMNAEHLFLLTNVDGVYSSNPTEAGAELYSEILNVNLELLNAAKGKSDLGRGGMLGKLQSARLSTAAGITTHILNGNYPDRISKIIEGEHFGTVCRPRTHGGIKLSNRDRWVMSAKGSDGTIKLDEGAAKAVKSRKSLLAVGVKAVYGEFEAGDSVEIIDHDKETIAIGLINKSNTELRELISKKEIPHGEEIMHADDIILI